MPDILEYLLLWVAAFAAWIALSIAISLTVGSVIQFGTDPEDRDDGEADGRGKRLTL